MVTLLIILFLALPLLFFLVEKHRATKEDNLPPGPNGLPLLGNLHQLDTANPQKCLWQLSKRYGPLMFLRLGFKPTLIVSSANFAREVLKTHDLDFCNRPSLTGQRKLSYNGLDLAFAPYDDYWKEMRKICTIHLFSAKITEELRPVREEEVSVLLGKIRTSASASAPKPFDLSKAMVSLTNTIISRITFGKRFEDGGSERARFQGLLKETEALLGTFFLSDYFPCMGWADKVSGLMPRLEKKFKELDAFYQEMIDEHLDPKRPKPAHETILDVLLRIYKDDSSKFPLTFDHVKAILMDVFVAGTETSAATVIWAMSILMKHPEKMENAQKEVRNLVGNKGFVDEDDIEQLSYLKAVFKETMRLQPSSPLLIPREAIRKCNIGGYTIPAKTLIYVNVWAIGRDPDSWENPFVFNPERFLNSSIDLKGQNFELIPFGAGRRMCPGILMGISKVQLSLANLLYKFDWEMPAGVTRESIDIDHALPGITMQRRDALCLVPKVYV